MAIRKNFPRGSWPVLFTPFTEDGQLDEKALGAQLEFYIQTGQAGLFANALSGEVFALSPEERVRVCSQLVAVGNAQLPIVAGGNFGRTLKEQGEAMRAIEATGVDAVIAFVSLLPQPQALTDQLMVLADSVRCPLGVYECPVPDHRLLTPAEVKQLAQTGRFYFMKETSRKVSIYAEKLAAAAETPLQVYQANLRCAPSSIDMQGPGVCGTFSNFCPEWSARLCDESVSEPERRAIFRAMVALHDVVFSHGYPSSGKYILQKRGLAIETVCRRLHNREFGDAERASMDAFLKWFDLETPNVSQDRLEGLLAELGEISLVD